MEIPLSILDLIQQMRQGLRVRLPLPRSFFMEKEVRNLLIKRMDLVD